MKTTYTLTLFSVLIFLTIFSTSCAEAPEDAPLTLEASDVSAKNCDDTLTTLNCFISVWNTIYSNSNSSPTNQVVLPLAPKGEYDFWVDWGDNTPAEHITTKNAMHQYNAQGKYTIYIAGTIKGWGFNSTEENDDATKLVDITQWGALSLGDSAGYQFAHANNFNPTATDSPNLSKTKNLSYAFQNASNFNAAIGNWDVSQITNMDYMFNNASAFDQPLDEWNVTAVTNMGFMFSGAAAFNQNISGWNVAGVENFSGFAEGSPLGDDINANKLPPKLRSFYSDKNYKVSAENCDDSSLELNCFISTWDTSKTNEKSSSSNHIILPLISNGEYNFYVDWGDNTPAEHITNYLQQGSHTYTNSGAYTIHIAGKVEGWSFYINNGNHGDALKLLNVKQWGALSLGDSAGYQFAHASNFNPTATDSPNLSKTKNLSYAFQNASKFNGAIGNWDVSQITNMDYMFNNASAFDQPLDGWNVDRVESFSGFAEGSPLENYSNNYKLPPKFHNPNPDVYNKVSAENCDDSTLDLNCFISTWDTSKTDENSSSSNHVSLPLISNGEYNFYVDWGDETPAEHITNYLQQGSHTYTNSGAYTIHIAGKVEGWSFYINNGNHGDALKLLNVKQWGALSLGDSAGYQFAHASNFNPTATDSPNLSKTKNLSYAFQNASKFNGAIGNWDVSQITNMDYMFNNASAFNQPLDGWNVDRVDSFSGFAEGSPLENYSNNYKLPPKFHNPNPDVYSKVSAENCDDNTLDLNCFISTWDTSKTNEKSSSSNHVSLPLINNGEYNFWVDWGDNTPAEHITTKNAMHQYNAQGKYSIYIAGTIKGWGFNSTEGNDDATKLVDITQWGALSLGDSAGYQFAHADNFNPTATDSPNLSKTKNLSYAFQNASNFNGAISNWDVSQITNMDHMFNNASTFNQDISGWNVERVENFSSFAEGSPLGNYSNNYKLPPKFHNPNPDKYSKVSVDNCDDSSLELNCFISTWDTSKTNEKSSSSNRVSLPIISNGEYNFWVDWGDNTPAEHITNTSPWRSSHTYTNSGVYTIHIAGKIKGWRFLKRINMSDSNGDAEKILHVKQWGSLSLGNTAGHQFANAKNFNPTATDSPDLSQTKNLSYAFQNAYNFNGAIGNWDVSQITNMNYMFRNALTFNQDISGWNVDRVDSFFGFAEESPLENDINARKLPIKFIIKEKLTQEKCDNVHLELNCFISSWNTFKDTAHISRYRGAVALPLVSNGEYNFWVDWGDETPAKHITNFSQNVHSYKLDSFNYTVIITGKIKGWKFHSGDISSGYNGTAERIIDIKQWGSLSLGNTAGHQFHGAINFNFSATDTLDLSDTKDLSYAFYSASNFNSEIDNWDVLSVTNMENMFSKAQAFNKPLDQWNVSSVKNMKNMFADNNVFNSDLNGWGSAVSNVTNMENMFSKAQAFNKPLDQWNVSSVKNMKNMFADNNVFNSDLNGWGSTVSNVTNMENMFSKAQAFNKPLDQWNVSSVKNMKNMFADNNVFNSDLNGWGSTVSNVTNMENMFSKAQAFNKPLDQWNVSSVKTMKNMFADNNVFNSDLNGWGSTVSNVTNMENMFSKAQAFNKPLDQWNVSSVKTMKNMFADNNVFNSDLNGWGSTVSNVTNMENMFSKAQAFNKPLDQWNVSSVKNMRYMFADNNVFNSDLNGWGSTVSNVTNMENMFSKAQAFNKPLDQWNVSSVKNMTNMFADNNVFNSDLNGWGSTVSNVTNMENMFSNAPYFNKPLDQWNVSSVKNMKNMFADKKVFNADLNGWGSTVSNVTNMENMFSNAPYFNKPLDQWNVSSVKNMRYMFAEAWSFNQDISGWNVDRVEKYANFALGSPLAYKDNVEKLPEKFQSHNYFPNDTNRDINSKVSGVNCSDGSAFALNCFISVWDLTQSTGTLELPLVSNGTYDFYVNWGDHTPAQHITTAKAEHVYADRRKYTVLISGEIKGWNFKSTSNIYGTGDGKSPYVTKLIDVTQWGSLSLGNTPGYQFASVANFNPTASDAPDLSQTKNLSYAFQNASNFNGAIGHWDVSHVTDMEGMFSNADAFNQPLDQWNVSGVTNMSNMFADTSDFNNKLNGWGEKASNVTDMKGMFSNADAFNQPLDQWNVSSVKNMRSMFRSAATFNQPLDQWDVSGVTDMREMFANTSGFNNKLNGWREKVSNVTDMDGMFRNADAFNQPLDQWNVSGVTNMYGMFYDATVFNQDISGWNVKVAEPAYTFAVNSPIGADNNGHKVPPKMRGYNQDSNSQVSAEACADSTLNLNCFISKWSYQSLVYRLPLVAEGEYDFWMTTAFGGKKHITDFEQAEVSFNSRRGTTIYIAGKIKGWSLSSEDNALAFKAHQLLDIAQWGSLSLGNTAGHQFSGASNFNPSASDTPDLSETRNLEGIFSNASKFNNQIDQWDVSKVTNMARMFENASIFNQPLKIWDVSSVVDMSSMFKNADKFNRNINGWGNSVSNVTNMQHMFFYTEAFNQPLDEWNVSSVKNMSNMFAGSQEFDRDLNGWGNSVSNVTNMAGMFGSSGFNQPLGEWNVSNVTTMESMFRYSGFNQPLGEWNVSSVKNMSNMFADSGVFDADLNGWGNSVSNVTNMADMFREAEAFNQPLDEWNVSSVKNMSNMFAENKVFDGDLNGWGSTVSNVTNMAHMFNNTYAFNKPLDKWNVSSVKNMRYMFAKNKVFDGDLNGWGSTVSNVTNMMNMFREAEAFNKPLEKWNVSNVTNMVSMFSKATSFNQPLNKWNVANVTTMMAMFSEAVLFNQPLTEWDVSNVIYMGGMFSDATNFQPEYAPWYRP